jgi:hypothetical protein
MNNLVDYAIFHKHHELNGADSVEPHQDDSDEISLWQFMRTLSKPAQALLIAWLDPSVAMQKQISQRTVGRRNSLSALCHYMKEQGGNGSNLDKLQQEIISKAGIYES